MRLPPAPALLLAALAAAPLPAFAQAQGMTLAQVEARYPRMKTVHIEKCDRDGNEIYNRSELLCVQGIYQAMYIDR